eukprot:TRINITY_DN47964_c0_g1_i2.p1 TRINITY_DN47964_c0_g1~~TRINITY_DN47964_c0_g1_i2.p1  ORF type:complete len:369 (-),score=83.58 TRINITY_DN47964_c0_g1_i2:276-1382(-)
MTADNGRRSESYGRSRSRDAEANKEKTKLPRDLGDKLEKFKDRYPTDGRALDFLEKSPVEVIQAVLEDFKPRSEGDRDYSALVTNFTRLVRARVERNKGGGGGERAAVLKGNARSGRRREDSRGRGAEEPRGGGHHRSRRGSGGDGGKRRRRRRVKARSRSVSSKGDYGSYSGYSNCGSDAESVAKGGAAAGSCSASYSASCSAGSRSRSCSLSSSKSTMSDGAYSDKVRKDAEQKLADFRKAADERSKKKLDDFAERVNRDYEDRVAKEVHSAEEEMKNKLTLYKDNLARIKQARIEKAREQLNAEADREISEEEDILRKQTDQKARSPVLMLIALHLFHHAGWRQSVQSSREGPAPATSDERKGAL